MKWLSWSNVVLGLWLIVAPFAVGYSSVSGAVLEDVLMGIVIAVFALWRATGPDSEGMRRTSWVVAIAGLWVLSAPFVIGYSMVHTAAANDVIVGLLVLSLGAMRAMAPVRTARVS